MVRFKTSLKTQNPTVTSLNYGLIFFILGSIIFIFLSCTNLLLIGKYNLFCGFMSLRTDLQYVATSEKKELNMEKCRGDDEK